jgi:hypothetical protein
VINAPLIGPDIWAICEAASSLDLVEMSQPLPGWQNFVVDRILNGGTGRAAIHITVMPNGWTQVIDTMAGTCGLFTSFDTLGYLRGDEACISRGYIIAL